MPAAAVIPTLKVYVKVVAVKTLVVGFDGWWHVWWFFEGLHPLRPGHFPPHQPPPGCVTLNKLWCSKHVYCGAAGVLSLLTTPPAAPRF